jgi:hypothetical protein
MRERPRTASVSYRAMCGAEGASNGKGRSGTEEAEERGPHEGECLSTIDKGRRCTRTGKEAEQIARRRADRLS